MNYKKMFFLTLIVLVLLILAFLVVKGMSCDSSAEKQDDLQKTVLETEAPQKDDLDIETLESTDNSSYDDVSGSNDDTSDEIIVKDWINEDDAGFYETIDMLGYDYYTGNIIEDGKTAKIIADIIMENTLQHDLSKWSMLSVYYESECEVWVITYAENSLIEANGCGEDVEIALSKKTGEVIKIWYGE